MWVNCVVLRARRALPLCPNKQTHLTVIGSSESCHKRAFCDNSEGLPHDLLDARRSLRFKKRLVKTIAVQKTSKSWPVTTVPLYNCRISSNSTSSGFGTAIPPPGLAR